MILVVDDEHNLADTMVAILELAGYRGIAAYSAEEAMAILHREKPALIISDVVMPGANGVQLAIEARRLWPELQILLLSGNVATQQIMDTARRDGHAFELLAKPLPPEQLVLKVASLINGKSRMVNKKSKKTAAEKAS